MTDPPTPSELGQLADLAAQLKEATARREALKAHAPRQSPGGLLNFIRYFWDVLEPATEFVEGYVLEVMCAHLEAVTRGEIKRLLINVPPGFSKSLLVDVWWPAWEWSACKLPQMRYVSFSYSAGITERDNAKFRDLILSKKFQDLYGKDFELRKTSEVDVTNNKTGRKFASSVEGIGTGERGDRVILDDPHSVTQAESDIQRERTVEWFRRTLTNRLNSATESAIIIIMQRLHEDDISGLVISEDWDYCHLMVPMRFEPGRAIENELGYLDWRTQDGELAWPERFPEKFCQRIEMEQGPMGWAGQYMQRPSPIGGGILKREYWQMWTPDSARRLGFDGEKYPPFEIVIASLDTAATDKRERDPSACVVLGVWTDKTRCTRVMLIHAWAKRYLLSELASQVEKTCLEYRVAKVIIESTAHGHSVSQMLVDRWGNMAQRLYGNPKFAGSMVNGQRGDFGIDLVPPNVMGGKAVRVQAIQPLMAAGVVWAPCAKDDEEQFRDWAEEVIRECEVFPAGRHDDMVDALTQGMLWLRNHGLAVFPDERTVEQEEEEKYKRPERSLYPA